jgi:hypothetical protein
MFAMVFNAQPCLSQTKLYCPLDHFGVFLYVSSSIHNPMQHFLSRVYIDPLCHLSLDPIKRNQAGLGPEISAAKELYQLYQSNNFCNADSSKL